jgi:hypothetical protein
MVHARQNSTLHPRVYVERQCRESRGKVDRLIDRSGLYRPQKFVSAWHCRPTGLRGLGVVGPTRTVACPPPRMSPISTVGHRRNAMVGARSSLGVKELLTTRHLFAPWIFHDRGTNRRHYLLPTTERRHGPSQSRRAESDSDSFIGDLTH